MNKRMKSDYLMIVMPVIYLLASIAVVIIVCRNGSYPSGSDTMYHVYRGDFVYNSLKEGTIYPLYSPMWYNGVELMRYWAPLPAYYLALCQALAGGNAITGYLIFVGSICFLGALPWLYIGKKTQRPWLGAFLGLLWFFMPNNLTALFVEGNLARSLCMIFLPVFIYAVCEYLEKRKWCYLPVIIVSFSLMALCHLGYAGMIALAVLLYCIFNIIMHGNKKATLELISAILIGFIILGIWMVASLNGGITSLDNSENMSRFFQSILISLNPLERYDSSNGNFYFGLAAICLSIYGVIFSYKKSMKGFWTGITICICTTTAMYPVLKILPGSQYLWMLRFISIALCIILYSFVMWDTLKKPLVVIFCLLLIADVVPSLSVIYGDQSGTSAEQRLNSQQEYTLIKKAQDITKQRLALMDESSMGATGAWLVSGWNNKVAATFGAGREAANTSVNIVQLNRALTDSKFYYLFDRCMELGNDTVLIQRSQLNQYEDSVTQLNKAASAVGYKLVAENSGYMLYHMDINGNWGTVASYEAIGIGSGAATASRQFPTMEETTSYNLNDYSFDQLSKYKLVFLDGFTYDDKEKAEELILKLSESGVRVVIGADGIPQDKKTHDQSFLGVTCNSITFKNGYPEMETKVGTLYTDLFPKGFTTWQTVYLEGLDTSWGTIYENGFKLDFYGTVKNDNIIMVGLNLNYFYGLTNDQSVRKLLENMINISSEQLPERKAVPLTIEYTANSIIINSDSDNVNTSLAYHDNFRGSQNIYDKNHLLYVGKGLTLIELRYPYLWQGILVSLAGIIIMTIWLVKMKKILKIECEDLKSEAIKAEDDKMKEECLQDEKIEENISEENTKEENISEENISEENISEEDSTDENAGKENTSDVIEEIELIDINKTNSNSCEDSKDRGKVENENI